MVPASAPVDAQPGPAAAARAFVAAPGPTAAGDAHSSSAYLVAAGCLAVSVVVSLRARRKRFTLEDLSW